MFTCVHARWIHVNECTRRKHKESRTTRLSCGDDYAKLGGTAGGLDSRQQSYSSAADIYPIGHINWALLAVLTQRIRMLIFVPEDVQTSQPRERSLGL